MHPGWYSDPYAPHGLRWWDGNQWTAWATPSAAFVGSTSDPIADLTAEETIGRWAAMGLIAAAAINIVSFVTSAVMSHRLLRDLVHQFRIAADNPDVSPRLHIHLGTVLFYDGLGLLQLALQVLVMIWLYRAATFARRAGLPARRDPVWAWAGFIVPIVNFWFPYQVAADTTPSASPARALALRWWCSWIGQAVLSTIVAAVSYFSVAAALGCACIGTLLAVLTAWYGRAMIATVGAVHAELAARAS